MASTWTIAYLGGAPEDLHGLGMLYARGVNDIWDAERAVECFRRAARAGFAPSQLELARAYARGIGAPLDHLRAMGWLLRAADQGYQPALEMLGRWWS